MTLYLLKHSHLYQNRIGRQFFSSVFKRRRSLNLSLKPNHRRPQPLCVGGSGVLVEWESWLRLYPGFESHWSLLLNKRNLPFALPGRQVWAMPFRVAQVSSVMMSSPSPTGTNGAQDLHENLLCIGDAGLSYQNELNRTVHWQWNFVPTPLPCICHLEYKNKWVVTRFLFLF